MAVIFPCIKTQKKFESKRSIFQSIQITPVISTCIHHLYSFYRQREIKIRKNWSPTLRRIVPINRRSPGAVRGPRGAGSSNRYCTKPGERGGAGGRAGRQARWTLRIHPSAITVSDTRPMPERRVVVGGIARGIEIVSILFRGPKDDHEVESLDFASLWKSRRLRVTL